MNYVLGVIVAFLLFPVAISGLARFSHYLDDKTVASIGEDR